MMKHSYCVYDIEDDSILLCKSETTTPAFDWVKYDEYENHIIDGWILVSGNDVDTLNFDLIQESGYFVSEFKNRTKRLMPGVKVSDRAIIVVALRAVRIVRMEENGVLNFLDSHMISEARYRDYLHAQVCI